MTSTTSISTLWADIAEFIGLDSFKSEFLAIPSSGESSIVLEYRIPAADMAQFNSPGKMLQQVFIPIAERIKNSRCVRGELADLQEKVRELEAENSKLQRYKAHFETEFLLRHGKEVGSFE